MGGKVVSSKQRSSRLILIDGNAILHRAYHALPPLTTKKGEPVNAVYGFISMLFKVIADLAPTHLIVCFDRPEPTFRKQIYVSYQAQRPKMEEELISQLELVKKVVAAMKIPLYELAGFEADDIIGTLASLASQTPNPKSQTPNKSKTENEAMEVIIVTGDRDILQLVSDKVKVYMPIKGLSQAKLYGEKEVEEKYGIKPSQIVDYKALVGDPSDNYPGVKGIGPKTARELLKKFASLEEIYKGILKRRPPVKYTFLREKVVKALAEGVEEARMAKKLAKIETSVPVTLELEKARLKKLDTPKLRKLFRELEFKSLLKRLRGEAAKKKNPYGQKKGRRGERRRRENQGREKRKNSQQLSLISL